jgi:hypothetical protein
MKEVTKQVLDENCAGIRRYTKKCRDWLRMESNIERIRGYDEKSQCTDSVVDAAGDIGNYLALCPGMTCYEALNGFKSRCMGQDGYSPRRYL